MMMGGAWPTAYVHTVTDEAPISYLDMFITKKETQNTRLKYLT